MERKPRRTVIDISQHQSKIDFEEAELSPPFTFPEYQRSLLIPRFVADVIAKTGHPPTFEEYRRKALEMLGGKSE